MCSSFPRSILWSIESNDDDGGDDLKTDLELSLVHWVQSREKFGKWLKLHAGDALQ